jgi:hypothetical protein
VDVADGHLAPFQTQITSAAPIRTFEGCYEKKGVDLDGGPNQTGGCHAPVNHRTKNLSSEDRIRPLRGGGANVRRTIKLVSAIIALIAISLPLVGATVSAADTSSAPVITFDDAARQAQLLIPTPACPASQPNCQWKFFLNEPKLSIDVATVYGTSGTLTIDYPSDFCGIIQADAYVGPPWVAKRGFQHTIEDCTPPISTSTPPDAPITSPPAPPTVSATSIPPGVGSVPTPGASPPLESAVAAPPVTSPAGTSGIEPVAAASSQLPFTGTRIKPILFGGITLVAMGLFLLTTAVSRRKMARRVGDCPWPTTRALGRSSPRNSRRPSAD